MNTLRGADLFVFIPDIPGLPDISAFLVKYYKLSGSFSDTRQRHIAQGKKEGNA